ncbi:MAG: TM1266 family iron-only hydrogenase system putative regulator [Thermoguttaceae bacterium]
MITRIAVIGIIVEENQSVDRINSILSDYRDSIIGRLGIPYEKRGLNVISIVVDASTDSINALTGKLATLPGVSAKAVFSRTEFVEDEN